VPVISDRDYFADEVAIDFPSLAPLTARARQAFLAGSETPRPDGLSAEVCVSSDDAYRGAVVPLGLRVHGTCYECGGRGEVWLEPCPRCGGTGEVVVHHRLAVTIPPRVSDGSRFHFRIAAGQAAVRVQVRIAIRA
jgi:hypothetical protein